jgi:hypothetical protein
VTDSNGCRATSEFPVWFGPGLSVSTRLIGSNNFTAVVVGGLPSYQFFWTPGGARVSSFVGSTGASYIVSVTDSRGCIVRASTNSAALPLPISPDPVAISPSDDVVQSPLSLRLASSSLKLA